MKVDFYKFSYMERNQGLSGGVTVQVAIGKGKMKEVEKWFKKNFSSSFKGFEKSSEKDFMYADILKCYVNTQALGRGFSPLYKKEGLAQISENVRPTFKEMIKDND